MRVQSGLLIAILFMNRIASAANLAATQPAISPAAVLQSGPQPKGAPAILMQQFGVDHVNQFVFAPDAAGKLHRWSLPGGDELVQPNSDAAPIFQLHVSDATVIGVSSVSGHMMRFDPRTLQVEKDDLFGDRADFNRTAFTRDGSHFFSQSTDGKQIEWDAVKGWTAKPNTFNMTQASMTFLPGGREILLHDTPALQIFSLARGTVEPFCDASIRSDAFDEASFSVDGHWLALAGPDVVNIVDLRKWRATKQIVATRINIAGSLSIAAFSTSGNLLAVADGVHVHLFDCQTQQPALNLPDLSSAVVRIRFVPGTPYVITATADQQAVVWDLRKLGSAQNNAVSEAELSEDLNSASAVVVYNAGVELLNRGKLIAVIRELLSQGPSPTEWIARLNSPDSKDREKAHLALERLGWTVKSEVLDALQTAPPGEARDRLESIARVIGADATVPRQPSAFAMRCARLCEMLSWSDDAASRQLSRELARRTAPATQPSTQPRTDRVQVQQ